MKRLVPILVVAAAVVAASPARAGLAGESGPFQPAVPVSAFARPSSWLDPSRLQLSTEVAFGTGFAGGSQGLQVTRLSYRFGEPLAMRVSVGNSFGGPAGANGRMFLEGLDLAYRPFQSMLVQIRYQDVRSPLQSSRSDPYRGIWP